MIEKVIDSLEGVAEEGVSLISLVPHFFNNIESAIDSFDDADQPLNSGSGGGENFVTPHWVDSYINKAGDVIEGFWRDGDGDTSVDLTEDEGGGYFRNLL